MTNENKNTATPAQGLAEALAALNGGGETASEETTILVTEATADSAITV